MKYWDFIERFRPQGLPLPAGVLVVDKQTTLRARRMPYRYWVQHPGRLDNLLILGTFFTATYVCTVGGRLRTLGFG